MISTHSDAEKFAAEWAAAWNRRDAEAVLTHFRDDIIFTSPTALAVIGSPVVRGKDALRAYWSTALACWVRSGVPIAGCAHVVAPSRTGSAPMSSM